MPRQVVIGFRSVPFPHSRAAVTAGYLTRSRKLPSSTGPLEGEVKTSAFLGRPLINRDMPSSTPGGAGMTRCDLLDFGH